ncbi:hypothetical protein NESM_000492500 [Novymonas esmeraldas]|uniref:Uncharacterized protein n=1 Tax=Novymonas esmeraldas TaxID=1808958 RepID=A0AAW0ERR7_9TRYP
MYRAGSRGAVAPVRVAMEVAARSYTPIYAADAAADRLATPRVADECSTLWAQHIPVPSLSRAVEVWLRFGNDPVVHTAAVVHAAAPAASVALATSPFAHVEDYAGSNMVTGTPEHVRESAALWSAYFEAKYLRRMRLSRRTSKQYVGVLGGAASGGGGAAALLDEADHPNTRWEADTDFREIAYLSERHLRTKVMNQMQLDKHIWCGTADVDAVVQFFGAVQQQTVTRVPLPVPSIWVYESPEAQRRWVERYLPVCKDAHAFFSDKLRPHAGDAAAQTVLLADVAAAYKRVHAILLERHARQVAAGLCPSAWTCGGDAAAEDAWAANEVEKDLRRVDECVYDPEDILDTTPEWGAEHTRLQAVLEAPLSGAASYSFSLHDFWVHTERREALETIHILESESLASVAAAARRRLLSEVPLVDIFAAVEESVAKARLDLRAAVLTPHFNSVWCRLHYVKFGAASLVHHTHTASRQLLFHYAASTQEVAATAHLYYATKPLSSQLDYASPYTLRRSLARHCSHYGVEMAHAAQQPLLLSAAALAKAEGAIGRVARHTAVGFGVRRRARHAAATARNARLLNAVKAVRVTSPPVELLAAGADLRAALREESTPTAASPAAAELITVWPMGSRQRVSYDWTSPALERLRLLRHEDGAITAEQAARRDELRQAGRLEVSLWRRRSAAERQRARAAAQKEAVEVQALLAGTPVLREVSAYAARLFTTLTRERATDTPAPEPSTAAAAEEEEEEEWVFAVMLDDNVRLSESQSVEVLLPHIDAAGRRLGNGEYRVCVRAVDRELNPSEHPTLMSEAVSASFSVVDALPQLYAQYTQHHTQAATATATAAAAAAAATEAVLEGDMEGRHLTPLCAFLREAGLHIPLRAELAVGQSLDKEGRIAVAEMAAVLRGGEYHRSQSEHGITDAQRTIEPQCRLHWTLYHPGATEYEWAAARRQVLQGAMAEERDWWLPDPMLDVADVRTDNASSPSLDFSAYPAVTRYGAELCSVLPAHGSNHTDYAALPPSPGVTATSSGGAGGAALQADCTVDGTGAITSLHFGAATSAADTTVEDALAAALESIRVAQMRHNTLSMVKVGAYEKQAQTMLFCGIHGLEFGGKYGRTYAYALEKAKREMAETAEAGHAASIEAADAETQRRRSEQPPTSRAVDRYASQTNPEQRLTRFAPRVTLSNNNAENLVPDQTSTWGR